MKVARVCPRGLEQERKAAPAMAGPAERQAQKTIHVGGEWREAVSGETREVLDPADAKPFAVVAEGDGRDVDAAVDAARRAFDEGPWPRTPVAERSALLRRVADLLVRDRERLGLLESRDAGKTLEEGRVDIDCVVDAFRYFADLVVGEGGGGSSTPGPTTSTALSCMNPSACVP